MREAPAPLSLCLMRFEPRGTTVMAVLVDAASTASQRDFMVTQSGGYDAGTSVEAKGRQAKGMMESGLGALALLLCLGGASSLELNGAAGRAGRVARPAVRMASTVATPAPPTVFERSAAASDAAALKQQILQLGASLDRGQAYNPTSGEYYAERMAAARERIESLIRLAPPPPTSLAPMAGEWELVLTTVPHGIFRSSPFFLAIQEAYVKHAPAGEPTAVDKLGFFLGAKDNSGASKAALFFKLHELQVCSWGASKVGRVAQQIDAERGMLFSEFDTSIFSLTVIPILGWFKLLPTFGGCVVTASSARIDEDRPGVVQMTVQYTQGKKVPGLSGVGAWVWSIRVPVRAAWKLFPWNQGREPTCEVEIAYLDSDFRVARDMDGECFVYTRPVVPRA